MRHSKIGVLAFFTSVLIAPAAWATCPTFHNLTNGSTADASQVMDNYNYILTCGDFATIGIGTNSPSAALDITGNSTSGPTVDAISFNDTGSNASSRNWVTGNASGPNYGDFAFSVSSARGGNPITAGSIVLNLSKSGFIGMGTSAPAALLDLTGNSYHGATNIAIRLTDNGGNPSARNWIIGNSAGANYGDLAFIVSPSYGTAPATTVLDLARGGFVGINTSTPAQALEVNGQIKVDSLASASSTSLCINAGVISSCSSSLRYKEDVRNANFGLDEVKDLRPVLFKWKGRDEQDFGLIAEEVAKVNPLFVTYKNGKIEGVKYPQLTAVLIGAVKALREENDRQATELARLRSEEAGKFRKLEAELRELKQEHRQKLARN